MEHKQTPAAIHFGALKTVNIVELRHSYIVRPNDSLIASTIARLLFLHHCTALSQYRLLRETDDEKLRAL